MARAKRDSRGKGCSCAWRLGLLVAVAVAAVAWATWYRPALRPADPTATGTVLVQLKPGSSLADFCRLLAGKGLLRSETAAMVYGRASGQGRRLKAGYYDLSAAMSTPELFATVAEGKIARRRVVVAPGLRLAQVARRVGESGLRTAAEFLAAARAEDFAGEAGIELPAHGSLEGYLWPATYTLAVGTTPHGIALAMLEAFRDKFARPHEAEMAAGRLSLHSIVTLASLVEREAAADDERPLIAGVMVNRLARGMRLQCDATVQYALPHHKTRLLYADLATPSPYNTYLHAGLPPGPICSPGEASLLAALHPARHDYLFYVASGNGRHTFTRTYQEHLAAIARLRTGGRR
jgi:UPF0755 protein